MGKEYVFNFIDGEENNSRTYMMASNESSEDWKKRLQRNSWCNEVDASAHISNMISDCIIALAHSLVLAGWQLLLIFITMMQKKWQG